jgi:Proteasome-substrate-size regulator, mid region
MPCHVLIECRNTKKGKEDIHLRKSERENFVKTILRLMEKGQYSKNEDLTDTVTRAISLLSYVEPSIILPFISSRFHLALETVSASSSLFFFCLPKETIQVYKCIMLYFS